jgi:hypothetical protein
MDSTMHLASTTVVAPFQLSIGRGPPSIVQPLELLLQLNQQTSPVFIAQRFLSFGVYVSRQSQKVIVDKPRTAEATCQKLVVFVIWIESKFVSLFSHNCRIQDLSILRQLVKSKYLDLALIPTFHCVADGVEPPGMINPIQ